MKIVDVALTLFRWDGIPPVVYGPNIRMPGGSSTLGLLAVSTDEGVTGHSFLGGATRGAELEGACQTQQIFPMFDYQRCIDALHGQGVQRAVVGLLVDAPEA